MESTHDKGLFAQLVAELHATRKGWIVSRPTRESRYDLILDNGERLYRAQVKYCDHNNTEGSVIIDLQTECRNNGYSKTYTAKEIDVVLVYLPSIDTLLWLGPEIFDNRKSITIRTAPAKNNQAAGITLAEDVLWK